MVPHTLPHESSIDSLDISHLLINLEALGRINNCSYLSVA